MSRDSWIERARKVPIERVIAQRGIKLKGTGAEREGPCPKCGGDDRFAINVRKQVFHCRQCGIGGDVIKMVEFFDGVDFMGACTSLTGEPPPKANGKDRTAEAKKIVVDRFDYPDEGGKLLFQVERMEFQNPDGTFVVAAGGKHKKTFRQRRPDPERVGGWLWNVDGVPFVPYRLPELIEAIANEQKIFIVEGEAKVELLRSWNIPATCCAGGAKKWRPEHSAYLRGADAMILPDNDAAGRDHEDVVATSLQDIAACVRVLELPGLPPKGDVIDWRDQGGTVEKLHELIAREAKSWRPHKAEEPRRQKDSSNIEDDIALVFATEHARRFPLRRQVEQVDALGRRPLAA